MTSNRPAATGRLPFPRSRLAGEGRAAGGAGGGERAESNALPVHIGSHQTSRRTPALRFLAGLLLIPLAGLAACSSSPPPRLILLNNDVAVPAAPATAQRPVLVVRTAALPEYLDHRHILYRSSDSELKHFSDVEWAERLKVSVTRWLARQLAAELPQYEVEAFTTGDEMPPAVSLNLELQSFEPDAAAGGAPVLRLRGAWHLSGQAGADGDLTADVPMGALDPAATVAAMRTALQQNARTIAARVGALPAH